MTQLDSGRLKAASGAGVTLAIAVASVAGSATAAQADEHYTVRAGDTVSHIALRSGASIAAIARANHLTDPARIVAGQHLLIPSAGSATSRPSTTPARHADAKYTVVSGDTVSHIAASHGTSVAAIIKANELGARAFIRVGQKLTIPGSGTKRAVQDDRTKSRTMTSYTVVPGDTVSHIAANHGTSVAAIIKANSLDARAFIRIGQKLLVPGKASTGTTSLRDKDKVGSTFAGRTYPDHVVSSANKNKATLLDMGVPSREAMKATVRSTAKKMGVDPALALAVGYQESGFNHASVSPANAIGTMQVIPSSGEWASDLVGRELNLLDPQDNVTAGVAILRQLVAHAPDLPTAIAGYYQGASSVHKHGMFADTRRYVANVQTLMARFD